MFNCWRGGWKPCKKIKQMHNEAQKELWRQIGP